MRPAWCCASRNRPSISSAQFEVNVFGAHELTRLILPVMRAQGHGRIIQNSSLLGLVALKYRGAYTCRRTAPERGSTERVRDGNTYCHTHWRGAPGFLRVSASGR